VFPLPTNGAIMLDMVFGIWFPRRWNQARANTGHDRRLGQKILGNANQIKETDL
jgi:hypothetical protein